MNSEALGCIILGGATIAWIIYAVWPVKETPKEHHEYPRRPPGPDDPPTP